MPAGIFDGQYRECRVHRGALAPFAILLALETGDEAWNSLASQIAAHSVQGLFYSFLPTS